jgi:hypothetical protein
VAVRVLTPLVRCVATTTVSPAAKVFGETVMVQVVPPLLVIEQLPTFVVPFLKSVNTFVFPLLLPEFSVTTTFERVPATLTVFWFPPVAVVTAEATTVSGA